MKRKKSAHKNTLHTAVLFFWLVVALLIVSIGAKLTSEFLRSSFDGVHRYTVALGSQAGRGVVIFSVDPAAKSMTRLTVGGVDYKESGKRLKIPVDGYILLPQDEANNSFANVLKYSLLHYQGVNTSLTYIDIGRLYFLVKTISDNNVTTSQLSLLNTPGDPSSDLTTDKRISQLFVDNKIATEKVSIQIINSAGVEGFGNRLARLITNMGGNVVAVETAPDLLPNTQVLFADNSTYTYKKVQKLLDAKYYSLKEKDIAQIVIKLGKDSADTNKF